MDSNMDIVLVLGAFAGMLLAFYKVLDSKDKQASKDRESDRSERQQLTAAIKQMGVSSQNVADATEKSAQEAKERNGHLGEQNVSIAKLVAKQNIDTASIKSTNIKIANILSKSALIAAEDRDAILSPEQHIERQVVEHQEVKVKK